MSISRDILSAYRKLQYKLYRRLEYGTMPPGELCTHTPFEEEINHGDVVHPCVRYVPEGYLGHKWWMVYTPYYAANDTIENPILCYADAEEPHAPKEWKVAYQVQKQPSKGYNSDPTLFYDGNKLYVMWRENLTDRCDSAGYVRATFGAEIKANGISEIFGPLVGTKDAEEDTEVSPTFMRDKDGSLVCYAMHLKFHSKIVMSLPSVVKRIVNIFIKAFDVLGIWSQQKSYGIAIWRSNSLFEQFTYERTVLFLNKNRLYRPWHLDLFDYNDKRYAIVQTNQCNDDICLVESMDGINFNFLDAPLMTNRTCEKVGIYKPTGGIVNNIFYLYYTAQESSNRDLNKLYLTETIYSKIVQR